MQHGVIRRVRATASKTLPRPLVAAWQVREWDRHGQPRPVPPAVKQREIRRFARLASISTLVETGTYLGLTVDAMKGTFQRIYSVELDETLFLQAKSKFAKYPHITILQGDSGEVLRVLLEQVSCPCLFWLDAHYSGGETARGPEDTPILKELQIIFDHPQPNHVVLIDDVPDFNGTNGYPTVEVVESFVRSRRPEWEFCLQYDIMRIHPKSLEITAAR